MSSSGERDGREWTLWVCRECGWTTSKYPPRALCCSVLPHENYVMDAVIVAPKADLLAAEQSLREAREALEHLKEDVRRREAVAREREIETDADISEALDVIERAERAMEQTFLEALAGEHDHLVVFRREQRAVQALLREHGRLSNPDREETT